MRKGSESLFTCSTIIMELSPATNQPFLATGRTKELPPVKAIFIIFAKFLGLTDEHIIFPIPNGNHQLGRGERHMGTVQDVASLGKRGEEG